MRGHFIGRKKDTSLREDFSSTKTVLTSVVLEEPKYRNGNEKKVVEKSSRKHVTQISF